MVDEGLIDGVKMDKESMFLAANWRNPLLAKVYCGHQ
jgi:hypothetical protein